MKKVFLNYFKLILGLFICAVGIVTILNSNLGLSPWDVLNQGANIQLGITLGQANILVGIIFVIVTLAFKQPIGTGTVLNFSLVGLFIDLLMYLNFIPHGNNLISKFSILVVGIIIFSFGCFLYIDAGLGCGPRDGVMVILTKKTKYSLARIRTVLEVLALSIGYLLGGTVGIGTVISSLSVGPLMQIFFKLSGKNIKNIEHKSIIEEFTALTNFILKK